MASSPKFISLVFLILALFFTQIQARESQFFSKVTPTTTIPTTINTNNNNNVKDTILPTKEEDQQPEFLPETQSYGLYGQESSELPTSNYIPNYKPETTLNQESYPKYPNRNANYYHYNNNQYNNNAYDEQQEKLGETSLHKAAYTTTSNHNNNYYGGASVYSNAGKQGMSDTRYLENGKYFYDMKSENNYYPNDQYPTSRYNYNPASYYGKNRDSYEYNSNVGRYQTQNDFQDEQYVP